MTPRDAGRAGTPSLAAVAWAFLRRDLAIAASYRATFALRTLALVVSVVMLAYMARFVGASAASSPVARYGDAGFLGFWLVGVVGAELFYAMATALSSAVRRAQVEGTLDAMLSTPAPAAYVVLCAPLGTIVVGVVRAAATLALGTALYGVSFRAAHLPVVAVAVGLAVVAFAALTVLGGAVTMWLRRTDPLTYGLAAFGAVIGGVLFPVNLLPGGVAAVAYAFPLAPALEAVRLAAFAGAGFADVARELGALAAFAAVGGGCGAWLFAGALRRARVTGSLSHY